MLFLAYVPLYLFIARGIVFDAAASFGRSGGLPALVVSPDIAGRALSWLDPAFVLYVTDAIVIAPSVPALATALVIGILVAASGAVAVETSARRPAACVGARPLWLVAALPSFLVSFSCCAPSVLLLLGAGAAGAAVAVLPFLAPASTLALAASLAWTLRRLEPAVTIQGTQGVSRVLVRS